MACLCHCNRPAFTLLELILASATATILIGGLATSVFIATRAYDDADGQIAREIAAASVIEDICAEMSVARRFSERSSTAVTFTVPDRDDDGFDETIRYSWSGVANTDLTKQYNQNTPETILANVHSVNFEYFVRSLEGVQEPIFFIPGVTMEGFSDKQDKSAQSIVFVAPDGAREGDLLIAAAAVNGDSAGALREQKLPEWSLLSAESHDGRVTLGIWWRIAGRDLASSKPLELPIETSVYSWTMAFRGFDPQTPIESLGVNAGSSYSPAAPDGETQAALGLLLRIGAFRNAAIFADEPGLQNHIPITMKGAEGVSGGAGYQTIHESRLFDKASFSLWSKEPYVAASIVIAAQTEPTQSGNGP